MESITIYHKTEKYPNMYVAKLYLFDTPTGLKMVAHTYEEVRVWAVDYLTAYNGCKPTKYPRHSEDDPTVVESYM